MLVVIADETLKQAGMTEREAIVEIACRLYDAEKLALWPAAKMAGLRRVDFEQELINRKIPSSGGRPRGTPRPTSGASNCRRQLLPIRSSSGDFGPSGRQRFPRRA